MVQNFALNLMIDFKNMRYGLDKPLFNLFVTSVDLRQKSRLIKRENF